MANKYLQPINYFRKIDSFKDALIHSPFYDETKFFKKELEKFKKYNFDYQKAKEKIDGVLADLGKKNYESQSGMASIHWILFSAISQVSEIENILELGTYDGETALILSKLFPDSNITTIDLPGDDPIFATSYGREDKQIKNEFNSKRDRNLSNPNINYIERNSFFLTEEVSKKFDLVWVDAGHLYPEISWDICNGYNLCRKDGWILCDDIVAHEKGLKDNQVSPDSFKIWRYIDERVSYEVDYFLKRNHPKFSANPKKRKYVSLLKKTNLELI